MFIIFTAQIFFIEILYLLKIIFEQNSFDIVKAKETGKIIPAPGVNPEYDESIEEIKETERELDAYIKSQSKQLNAVKQNKK